MVFEKYWDEKAQYEKEHKVEMVRIVPMDNPAINTNILLQNIYNIDNMSDSDLRRFLQKSYRYILNNIFFDKNVSDDYINCFKNVRFLDAFIDVIATIQFFEKAEVNKINTICYHYIVLPEHLKEPIIADRMLKISAIINRPYIPKLLGLGLSENLANMLVICRYSDLNLNTCVKRVNFIIQNQPLELMSEEMIVKIYQNLYDVFRDFPKVFQYIMYDVLPEYDENNPKTHWINDEIQEVDSNISNAILNILDNLPSQTIRNTLVDYAEGYNICYHTKPIRFSMNKLSEDYYRINDVISKMRYIENIIVP